LAGIAVFPVIVVPWTLWQSAADSTTRPVVRPVLAGGILIVLFPLWLAGPGVGLALSGLMLAFAHGRAVLGVTGLVALLTYLARLYHQLETPLLHKAMWLGLAGMALILLSWALGRHGGEDVDAT